MWHDCCRLLITHAACRAWPGLARGTCPGPRAAPRAEVIPHQEALRRAALPNPSTAHWLAPRPLTVDRLWTVRARSYVLCRDPNCFRAHSRKSWRRTYTQGRRTDAE